MPANSNIDVSQINKAIEIAFVQWMVLELQKDMVDITPRDKNRLPQNINRKDGQAPHRSTYFKPVIIGGNWYAWVSGKLKQSIANKKESRFAYRVGVSIGPANTYAKYLEFWTRKMRPRSFVRKAAIENKQKMRDTFSKILKELLW